jgi:hypothetical protein
MYSRDESYTRGATLVGTYEMFPLNPLTQVHVLCLMTFAIKAQRSAGNLRSVVSRKMQCRAAFSLGGSSLYMQSDLLFSITGSTIHHLYVHQFLL